MDMSSFLKWDENKDKEKSRPPSTPLSLSFVQDNLSSFFNQNTNSSHDSLLTPRESNNSASSSTNNDAASTKLNTNQTTASASSTSSSAKNKVQSQLTDLLVEKLLSMALPPTTEFGEQVLQERVLAGKTRPMLSVPIMSKNFIQLNSRLSMPFETVDNVISFFSWESPWYTLTLLTLYTHIVLTPLPILTSLPFLLVCIYIMTPAYYWKHLPEQHTVLGKANPVLADGPELRKDTTLPHPAPEFSKEFILNLTDLQNHMVLYSTAWDSCVKLLGKFAYFQDECISSFAYVCSLSLGLVCLRYSEFLLSVMPWRLFLIAFGWGLTLLFHPYCYDYVFNLVYSEETRYCILGKTNWCEAVLQKYFTYDEPQEQREVEIFEIQEYNKKTKEWSPLFFLDNDYSKPSRLNGFNNAPSQTKEEVLPPKDWCFIPTDEWRIDLSPEEWIRTHLLEGVVRTDNETKWVYDLGDDTNNYQPQYRRRRWTRTVTRCSDVMPVAEVEMKKEKRKSWQVSVQD